MDASKLEFLLNTPPSLGQRVQHNNSQTLFCHHAAVVAR